MPDSPGESSTVHDTADHPPEDEDPVEQTNHAPDSPQRPNRDPPTDDDADNQERSAGGSSASTTPPQ